MNFREKVRLLRKGLGLPQVVLAERVGVLQSVVSSWETGRGRPESPERWLALARSLDVTVDNLMDPSADDPTARGGVLTADERAILDLAREIGLPLARRRLLGIDGGRE